MYIDKENFVAWMERIMDRLDMQDKKDRPSFKWLQLPKR